MKSKPYVVFLNGPPGSGKDYAANVLTECPDLTVEHWKFAQPLRDMLFALLEGDEGQYDNIKSSVIRPYNVTGRQIMIDMSEYFMKPCYGKDIFGQIAQGRLAEYIQNNDQLGNEHPDIIVFSDCGFRDELLPVIKLIGEENCFLIRLHRDGHTYEGDSRSYVEIGNIQSVDIRNTGTVAFDEKIIKAVQDWMNS